MGFIIGLLTFILVLDCIVLIFLVLLQLPKKEAGAGLAFGGAATDALFGAGSGNVLTKITKYAATTFFILAILLAVLQRRYQSSDTSDFERKLNSAGKAPAGAVTPGSAPQTAPTAVPGTNAVTIPTPAPTNAPATNSGAAAPASQ
jgi:preprotein translocase subunit SecG